MQKVRVFKHVTSNISEGKVLVFPILPLAWLSALVTFYTWLMVLAPLLPIT